MSRARLNVFLEREHAKSVQEVAAMKRTSKSAVIAAALASYLSPDGLDRREVATLKRLDRFAQQLERVERDQAILIETLALFVRHQLSVTTPIPEAQQEAARAQGRVRFEGFIEQLARHLQRGHSLVRDVFQEIAPAETFGGAQRDTERGDAVELPA